MNSNGHIIASPDAAVSRTGAPLRPVRVAIVEADEDQHVRLQSAFGRGPGRWELHFHSAAPPVGDLVPHNRAPKVVILDPWLPGLGVGYLIELKSRHPGLSVIAHTTCGDPASVARCLMAGADGYLIKPQTAEDLLGAAVMLASGRSALCARAQSALIELLRGMGRTAGPDGLSFREMDILLHLPKGAGDKDIARALGIEPGTVHSHLARIYRKLGVHGRKEAARASLRLMAAGLAGGVPFQGPSAEGGPPGTARRQGEKQG